MGWLVAVVSALPGDGSASVAVERQPVRPRVVPPVNVSARSMGFAALAKDLGVIFMIGSPVLVLVELSTYQ